MKKIILPLLILTLTASRSVMAQMDHKVSTGVIAFDQQDYDKALQALNEALTGNPVPLNDKNKPKAYFYRAQTWLSLQSKAAFEKNQAMIAKYRDAGMKAYEDIKNAEATDVEGKWKGKILLAKTRMGGQIMNSGIMALDESYVDGASEEQKKDAVKRSLDHFKIAQELQPDNLSIDNLMGQAYLADRDSASSMDAFGNAVRKFEKAAPPNPELEIGYIYYQLGIFNRYFKHNLDGALNNFDAGKKALDSEYNRIQAKKADYNPEFLKAADGRFATLKDALNKAELSILLESPEKQEKAIQRFEESLKTEPNNYFLHVAYAQLLSNIDTVRAITAYEKAIEVDPKAFTAYFNLGALYVNQGIAIRKAANDMTDYKKGEEYAKTGDELFRKAFPILEKAFEAKPDDLETVKALMQIAITLEMNDQYAKYNEIKKKLTGG